MSQPEAMSDTNAEIFVTHETRDGQPMALTIAECAAYDGVRDGAGFLSAFQRDEILSAFERLGRMTYGR